MIGAFREGAGNDDRGLNAPAREFAGMCVNRRRVSKLIGIASRWS